MPLVKDKMLPENHPLKAVQQDLNLQITILENQLKDAVQKEAASKFIALLQQYFNDYDINEKKDQAFLKWSQLHIELTHLLKSVSSSIQKDNFFKLLSQFQPKHISYYQIKHELEETVQDDTYNKDLRTTGKDVLTNIEKCRTSYRTDDENEAIFTKVLGTVNQGIKQPKDKGNFDTLIKLLPQLPKQRMDGAAIMNVLVGSLLIFLGTIAIVAATASMIVTSFATAPSAAMLIVLGAALIGYGAMMIARRDTLFRSLFETGYRYFEKECIERVYLSCCLFSQKQGTVIQSTEPASNPSNRSSL